MAGRGKDNWDDIIQDFREGMSYGNICDKHGISKAGLSKGLRRRGLTRNNVKMVRERARSVADEQMLRDAMMPINIDRVEALAEVGASVLTKHRRSLNQSQQLVQDLKQEIVTLNRSSGEVEESIIEYFGALVALNPAQIASIRQRLSVALSAISLPSRVRMMKDLAAAENTYLLLERKAYNLDEQEGEKTYEDYLREVHVQIEENKKRQLALTQQGRQETPCNSQT